MIFRKLRIERKREDKFTYLSNLLEQKFLEFWHLICECGKTRVERCLFDFRGAMALYVNLAHKNKQKAAVCQVLEPILRQRALILKLEAKMDRYHEVVIEV